MPRLPNFFDSDDSPSNSDTSASPKSSFNSESATDSDLSNSSASSRNSSRYHSNSSDDSDFDLRETEDSESAEDSLSSVSSMSQDTDRSSDTIEYDVPAYDIRDEARRRQNRNEIIEIPDTQRPTQVGATSDDDDVILIPQRIDVIDLSLSQPAIPNDVIVINDSPATQNPGPIRDRRRTRFRPYAVPEPVTQPGPSNGQTQRSETAAAAAATANASTSNLSDSLNGVPNISCPICLETIVGREPVSTNCGHLFCKVCIVASLRNVKKCPMCQKKLTGRAPFHNIFL